LVCPSLVATLAPRQRLQSDLSITRGGFARASAAKVRPLFKKKKIEIPSCFWPIPADFIPVVASRRSTGAIKNLERRSSRHVDRRVAEANYEECVFNERETNLNMRE